MSSAVLKSINEGYNFFTNWMDQILEKGIHIIYSSLHLLLSLPIIADPDFDHQSATQRKYLAWQSEFVLH